jgi:hypothetical protein
MCRFLRHHKGKSLTTGFLLECIHYIDMTSDVLGISKGIDIVCKKMIDRQKEMSTPQKEMVVS